MHQKFTQIFILIIGLIFLGFGLAYLFFPVTMIELSGMEIPTLVAKVDTWAIYAGIQIGFGVFLILCSKNASLFTAALLSIAFIFGGVAIGRTLGIVYYASYDQYSLSALLFEWPGTLIALFLYKSRLKHESRAA